MPVGDGRPRLRRGRTGVERIRPRGAAARKFHEDVGMDGRSDWHRMALHDPRGKKRSPEAASRPTRGTERGGE
jgi:hypothetical protein